MQPSVLHLPDVLISKTIIKKIKILPDRLHPGDSRLYRCNARAFVPGSGDMMKRTNNRHGAMVLIGAFPGEEGTLLRFWSQHSGWGRLVDADRYTDVPDSIPPDAKRMELVPAADPFPGAWGFNFSTRMDLMRVADFESYDEDAYGNPKVVHLECRCECCGYAFPRMATHVMLVSCPDCRNEVEPFESMWMGPDNDALEALWTRLPHNKQL